MVKKVGISIFVFNMSVYIYMILDEKTWESSKLLLSCQLSDVHGSVSAVNVSPTLVPCNFHLF